MKKWDTEREGDLGSIPGWERSPDTPLQYSCLGNPMDRGAWRAAVHRIAKSWTRLKQPSTHTHTHNLMNTWEKTTGSKRLIQSISRQTVKASPGSCWELWALGAQGPLEEDLTPLRRYQHLVILWVGGGGHGHIIRTGFVIVLSREHLLNQHF